jgi:hypothetical protein
MNTFKRKALTCAVLAGLGAVATTAEAVYRNPDNTGQVLIYPYYTVNTIRGNAYNTYISITNTTSSVKVLKVRFREGRTSAEVLDFNLYLSPNDMWVAPVGPAATGATVPPSIYPAVSAPGGDTSCTNPPIPATGQPFTNVAYSSNIPTPPGGDDLPGTGLERTREGYIEVFEMGRLSGAAATAVTHVTNGAPPGCASVQGNVVAGALAPIKPPTGGLFGQAGIINVTNGSVFSYVADALDAYSNVAYYAEVTTNAPTLGASATPPTSLVFANNSAYFDAWGGSSGASGATQAVAAVFMHSAVLNNYILDTATASNTDWVLTFPLKREFTGPAGAASVRDPFTANLTTAGACEPVQFTFFNRDEQSFIPASNLFSPPSAGVGGPGVGNLCWESTVVSVRNGVAHTSAADVSATDPRSGVLGSRNVLTVPVLGAFQNGWMSLVFSGARTGQSALGVPTATGGGLVSTAASQKFVNGALVGPGVHTFAGLPVTGFMVTAALNAAIPNCQITATTTGTCAGNYGQLFGHAYRTVITP